MIKYITLPFNKKSKRCIIEQNWALVITSSGTFKEKSYQELGLASHQQKLCHFFQIFENLFPNYLFNMSPKSNHNYHTRNCAHNSHFSINHNFFKNPFFPTEISYWSKLDKHIRHSDNIWTIKKFFLKFVRPVSGSIFICHHL